MLHDPWRWGISICLHLRMIFNNISFEITMKSEGEILNNCKLAHKNRFRVKNSETNAQGKNPILYRKVENYSNIWKSDKDGGNNR